MYSDDLILYTLSNESHKQFFLIFNFFFLPHWTAYGILVPLPGIKPEPPAMEAWSLNSWTVRGDPESQNQWIDMPVTWWLPSVGVCAWTLSFTLSAKFEYVIQRYCSSHHTVQTIRTHSSHNRKLVAFGWHFPTSSSPWQPPFYSLFLWLQLFSF